jgi:hypothetical protein
VGAFVEAPLGWLLVARKNDPLLLGWLFSHGDRSFVL